MALRNSAHLTTDNATSAIQQETYQFALSSNDQIPEFLYEQFPVSFFSFGALCNVFILYYIIASRKYNSPLFTFIASLAIADLLSCIGMAGWSGLLYPTITARYPTVACRAMMFVTGVGVAASVYHLAFFSCLRYYQLCYPIHARANVTRGFVVNSCIGIWFCGTLAWTIIDIWHRATGALYKGKRVLLCTFVGNVTVRDWYYVVFHTIIPAATILTMHLLKYAQLLCQARQTKHIHVQQERQNSGARAVAIVIVLFFIALCPMNIYSLIRTYAPNEYISQDMLALTLGYMIGYNSALNPIVYMIAVKSIRNDIQRCVCSGLNRFQLQTNYDYVWEYGSYFLRE